MNRTDRLMAIILLLRSRKKLTARQLAEIFEVSTRTIYRDIDSLCQARVPIAVELGPEGGYSLLDTYSLPPVMFSLDEAVALFLVGSFIARSQAMPFQEALKTALIKIEDILPEDLQESVRATSQATLFDVVDRGGPPIAREVFREINEAILEHKCVEITYRDVRKKRMTQRVVAPYGLIYDSRNGAWYLVGFCHLRGQQRMFHLARIDAIRLTDRDFQIPEEFELERLADRSWARSLAESLKREQPRIRIKVTAKLAERLQQSWLLRYAEREVALDGRVILTYHDDPLSALHFVYPFGADCEVLEPAELRQQVVGRARRVLALYGGQDEATDRSHEPA